MTHGEYLFKKSEIEYLWNACIITSTMRKVLHDYLLYEYSMAKSKEEEAEDEDSDRVTERLMADALRTHGLEYCPKCAHPGIFIRMALVCPTHGAFAGA